VDQQRRAFARIAEKGVREDRSERADERSREEAGSAFARIAASAASEDRSERADERSREEAGS